MQFPGPKHTVSNTRTKEYREGGVDNLGKTHDPKIDKVRNRETQREILTLIYIHLVIQV